METLAAREPTTPWLAPFFTSAENRKVPTAVNMLIDSAVPEVQVVEQIVKFSVLVPVVPSGVTLMPLL